MKNLVLILCLFAVSVNSFAQKRGARRAEAPAEAIKEQHLIRIESNDADVYLDSTYIGTGNFECYAAPGTYTITAKKERHYDQVREINLIYDYHLGFYLHRYEGMVSFISTPPGAEIWHEGEKWTSKKTPTKLRMPEGEYTVELRKQYMQAKKVDFEVKYNEETNVDVDLEKGIPNAKIALSTSMEIDHAEFYINGEKMDVSFPTTIEVVPEFYTLELKKWGYYIQPIERYLKEGETSEAHFKLIELMSLNPRRLTRECDLKSTQIIEVTNPKTGRTWMDRNIGAERKHNYYIVYEDTKLIRHDYAYSHGHRYQWGRHSDGHQCPHACTSPYLASSARPMGGCFILSEDWPPTWLISNTTNLWEKEEYPNNPCPRGFRIPTVAEWKEEMATWNSKDAHGASRSALLLPQTGFRNLSNGKEIDVNVSGYYWTSEAVGSEAYCLTFNLRRAKIIMVGKALGASVRCIKDQQAETSPSASQGSHEKP